MKPSVKGKSLWASGGRARYLVSQPPELRIEGALEEIRRRVVESGRRVAVLDDDPTGVQSVHGAGSYHLGDRRPALGARTNKPDLLHPDQLPQSRGGRGDCPEPADRPQPLGGCRA